jgi:mannose-6-phosphate isomerase-like protein (cupin superfamily)
MSRSPNAILDTRRSDSQTVLDRLNSALVALLGVAHRGQTIEYHALRERITFLTTAADSGGELLAFDDVVGPGNPGPPRHYHPGQEEYFEVKRGRMEIEVDGERRAVGPGDSVTVPPKVPHTFHVIGDEEAEVLTEFRPAGDIEGWLESVFALESQGKVGRDGNPKFLAVVPIARAHLDDFVLAGPPLPVMRVVLTALTPVARLLA